MVGEVAMVAADTLFEVQRPLGEIEHLVVVVRFEDEDVRQGAMVPNHVGRMSEVRQPRDAFGGTGVLGRAVDGVADWVGGVVWNRDRSDLESAKLKRSTCLEELPVGFHLQRPLDTPGSFAVGEDL